ncbi:MAG: ABC transporter ATP-binding protein [Bacteroidota bacterium]|nr:ABC transporter ATP-binding protein [Bacteroidota bacterium]
MSSNIAIKCRNLSKSYGSLKAVHQMNLEVAKGEIFGFLGPNGAGKSTSIMMICGLLKPDSGLVYINGLELRKNPSLSKIIGFCPQENVFWPKLNGLEQLLFMAAMYGIRWKDSKKRAIRLLDDLGLSSKSKSLTSKWSGGMKRRLNIALALIHDPDILILDEPEAGLDPQSRVLIREYFRAMIPQKTILLTTHNMDEADRMSDRVAIIDDGLIIALGNPRELKREEESLEDVFIRLTGKSLRS